MREAFARVRVNALTMDLPMAESGAAFEVV
jgi:hypothetical protein